ncbi:MAG TPA: DUF1573 domain-containing protein [Tepidisphaeraceae bacterium]|jgi:hypothetical protein
MNNRRAFQSVAVLLGAFTSLASAEPTTPLTLRANCGLDVAYTALRMFGQTTSLRDVADKTGLDAERRKLLSFLDLKQYLEGRGLIVNALKASTARALIDAVPANALAVVRTQSGSGNPHFFILMPSGNNVLFFDAYTRRSHAKSRDDAAADQWLLNMTGEFLVVTEAASKGAGLRWFDRSIDLGEHPRNEAVLTARVRFRNTSEQAVRLAEPQGSCDCMRQIDWPRQPVGPGKWAKS